MVDKFKEDVPDAEDLLRRALTVVFWLWHGGKVGQSSLEAAERITAHQGHHEAEVSCGGEADLHRHYTRCKKNPGHTNFIPIHDFKNEHLPSGYRDDVILAWIKAEADMTCRLSVRYTSENRPRFHPGRQPLSSDYPFYQDRGGDWLRTGTGYVESVKKYTEKDNRKCECDECTRPGSHTPKKVWGKVEIATACHVVFDNDEARHTTCEFFYDTSKIHISQCPTLTGLKVEKSSIKYDWCNMTYVSHDMDMIDKLYKIQVYRGDLLSKLYEYQLNKNNSPSVPGVSCLTDPTPEPTVIISHPHGCSKMVTVGIWTHRQTLSETDRCKSYAGWEVDQVGTRYTYNTPTCRGSSGAPVIRLVEKGKWWWGVASHFHSEGGQGNINKSGAVYELVSPPTFL